jgi:hypothetical protein
LTDKIIGRKNCRGYVDFAVRVLRGGISALFTAAKTEQYGGKR